MRTEDLLSRLHRSWPELRVLEAPVRLSGGLVNFVWRARVRGAGFEEPTPVILKYAAAHLASNREIALDPSRIDFEGQALELLSREHPGWLGESFRVPRLHLRDREASLLVMEDLGDLEDLAQVLAGPHVDAPGGRGPDTSWSELGLRLGSTMARLHRQTLDREELARDFRNDPVQAVREQVQYQSVAPLLAQRGHPRARELGRRAAELGRRLREPGRCLVQGDLWPRSVVRGGAGWAWIDWEFCHFGVPGQDLGHLAAHLWMLDHVHDPGNDSAAEVLVGLAAGYQEGAGEALGELLPPAALEDTARHMACEVLARSVGAFSGDSYYAPGSPGESRREEAFDRALDWLGGETPEALAPLGRS